ncbi:UNVERIFIED_CONTAM: permease, partial [Mumia flava]
MILSINYLYWLAGIILTITALMTFADKNHPRRWTTGLFWAIFAVIFLVGDKLPPIVVGVGAVVMALLAGTGGVTLGKHGELPAEERRASAKRLGNRLFIPALTIPLVTVIGSVFLKDVKIGGDLLLDPKNQTFVSLGLGCIISLALACWLTRDTPVQAMRESRRLTESLGWALVLPQMLAMLGLVFADAGVGKAVAHLTTAYINMDYRLVAVVVYCVGMALFTVIMGNGFAAFPVMTGGVG